MAVTNFSTLLGLALPTTGDLSGTWGTTVNDSITALIDSAVAGTTTLSANADVTLTTTNGAANQARNAVILWTASNGVTTRNITAPAQSKAYVVINAGTGSVVIRGAGPTAGVTVISGEESLVAWNGSDFVKVSSSVLTGLSGTLTVSNGGTGATTLTGLVKGNGTAAFTAAVANTDYLTPPSGTAILKANSGGALANAVANTDYLTPPSGTALLKANSGGALANATAGTDYVSPSVATTFTAKQTFSGSTSVLAAKLSNATEVVTVSATAATGTVNYDVTTQSVLYYTTSASGNWAVNIRANSSTTLDSVLSTNESVTVAFLVTQGGTAYYNSQVQIDGTTSGVTTKWQNGGAPSAGYANNIDTYTYTVIKTGSATFTVLASLSTFG